MNLRSLFAVAAIAAAALPAHAVTVVGWDFENAVAGVSTVASSIGTGTASCFHAGTNGTVTYSTPAGNGGGKSFSSNGWAVADYYQFSFSTLGYTGTSISFDQVGSATGPRDFAVQYSTNGTTYSSLSGGSYALNMSSFSGTAITNATYTFSLTALDNLSAVSVRLVDMSTSIIGSAMTPSGTVAPAGTDRVDNFLVSGAAVAAVPEPETYAMLFAGLGVVGFVARRRKA